jgi:hypothetical protein
VQQGEEFVGLLGTVGNLLKNAEEDAKVRKREQFS